MLHAITTLALAVPHMKDEGSCVIAMVSLPLFSPKYLELTLYEGESVLLQGEIRLYFLDGEVESEAFVVLQRMPDN